MSAAPTSGLTPVDRSRLREALRAELAPIEGVTPMDLARPDPKVDRLRRRGLRPREVSTTFTLVEVNGVLVWEEGFGLRGTGAGLRRGFGVRGVARGEIIERVQVQPLELGNEVTAYLDDLDQRWTPQQGLRELVWQPTGQPEDVVLQPPLPPDAPAAAEGKVLVFVHGTFSKSENLLDEIRAADNGKDFLARAKKHYDKVYAFNHPTVSVSPVLNAVELARHFRGSKAAIDVVAHSRGGLVTRWWLEVMEPEPAGPRRAVLVACPLDGTSLATPKRLRDALSWLTNVNQALATGTALASSAVPFLSVVSGLLRFAGTVTNVLGKTPVIDAGVSLIPGLSAMTRVNLELARLNVAVAKRPAYFAIVGDFDPPPTGLAVWRFITEAKTRLADAAADLLFQGKNDLVVDTESMTFLAGTCGAQNAVTINAVHDFKTQGDVHHLNYFRKAPTLDFIMTSLGF
jgi:alpha-beta hydrolase superfamily lysophospholipase